MKYLLVLLLFFAVPHYEVHAENILPNELLKEEIRTGKAILVYCYTMWCKPCAKMSKEVFAQKHVQNYIDTTYLIHKVDMDSELGTKYKEQYNITTYPTFLIFRKGEMIHKFIGAYKADAFLEKLKKYEPKKK